MARVFTLSVPEDCVEVLQYLESLPRGRRSEAIVVALVAHLRNGGSRDVTLQVVYERVTAVFEKLLSLTETLESGKLFVAGPPPDEPEPMIFAKNRALEDALAEFLKEE